MSFLDEFVGHMDNVIKDTQKHVDSSIAEAQTALESGTNELVGHTQKVTSDAANAAFGKDTTKKLEEGGLVGGGMGIFSDLQGQMMGMGVGNIAKSFGVSPKVILFVGAAIAVIVILMVLKGKGM